MASGERRQAEICDLEKIWSLPAGSEPDPAVPDAVKEIFEASGMGGSPHDIFTPHIAQRPLLERPAPAEPDPSAPAHRVRYPMFVDEGRRRSAARERTPGIWWAAGIQAAWVAVLGAVVLLEPPPASGAQPPGWVDVLGVAYMVVLAAAFAGMTARRRWGFGLSASSAAIGLALAAACAATGHHSGLWPLAEAAMFAPLVLLSLKGARRAA